jgi:hypothetical protein
MYFVSINIVPTDATVLLVLALYSLPIFGRFILILLLATLLQYLSSIPIKDL